MINVSELRIGNWVETYTVLLSGSWIDKDGNRHGQDVFTEPTIRQKQIDIEDLKIIASSTLATYRPIPLTQDILIKCGFDDINTEYCESFKLKQILIEYLPDTSIYARLVCGNNKSLLLTELKSLHQLQNLYFALTKTELNINL